MLVATGLAFLLERWLLPNTATVLILLLGVITSAVLTSYAIAALAAVIGGVVFNVLFTQPRGTLHMTEPSEIATLGVFVVTALVCIYWVIGHRTSQNERRAAEIRSQLLFSLSHDLRTPLASVMGNLTTWLDYHPRLNRAEQNELISNAVFEAERLQSYIDNVLHATRFAYHQVRLIKQNLQLNAVLQSVIDRFPLQQDAINLELPQHDVTIAGQRLLLEQGLFNLLDNALRYRLADTQVRLAWQLNDNQSAVLSISNVTLQDFNAGALQRWGQPFISSKQGDSGSGGLGLGIAVAESIFSSHGFSIQPSFNDDYQLLTVTIVMPTVAKGRVHHVDA